MLIFRKPFKHKTIVQDIITKEENNEQDIHGCGINIDGNRVRTEDNLGRMQNNSPLPTSKGFNKNSMGGKYQKGHDSGRYPANLYLVDGFNYTPEQVKEIIETNRLHIFENIGIDIEPLQYMTFDKQVEYLCNYLDKFEVSKVLDEQSGILKNGAMNSIATPNDNPLIYGKQYQRNVKSATPDGDEGGCSRVLHKCKYELDEFDITNDYISGKYDLYNYTTKVSQFERNAGCENLEKTFMNEREENGKNIIEISNLMAHNNHPTLKNMALNRKLINLFLSPESENFKIFIPFCGVNSEVIPALSLGIPEGNITAVEQSEDYCIIGEARKKYWIENNFYFKEEKEKINKIKKEIEKKKPKIEKNNLLFS